jgi:hypothetical protein
MTDTEFELFPRIDLAPQQTASVDGEMEKAAGRPFWDSETQDDDRSPDGDGGQDGTNSGAAYRPGGTGKGESQC